MRPGVCTAPEPAPERDRPSEGCQLAVLSIDFAWKLVHPPSYVNGVTERRRGGALRWDVVTTLRDDFPRRLSVTSIAGRPSVQFPTTTSAAAASSAATPRSASRLHTAARSSSRSR